MRTERDVRENPVAGDVFRVGNETRTVESVGVCVRQIPRIVYERCKVNRNSAQMKRWKKWVEGAEVLHIAQPGGEA